jgi:uncharacterized protein (DUF488 family)
VDILGALTRRYFLTHLIAGVRLVNSQKILRIFLNTCFTVPYDLFHNCAKNYSRHRSNQHEYAAWLAAFGIGLAGLGVEE